jgi:hypothetical protein
LLGRPFLDGSEEGEDWKLKAPAEREAEAQSTRAASDWARVLEKSHVSMRLDWEGERRANAGQIARTARNALVLRNSRFLQALFGGGVDPLILLNNHNKKVAGLPVGPGFMLRWPSLG